MKKLLSFLALFVVSLLTVSMVSAASLEASLDIVKTKINGNEVEDEEDLYVEAGETLDIELKLLGLCVLVDNTPDGVDNPECSGDSVKDIQVKAEINGFEYEDIEASTDMFDLEEGDSRWVDLSLTLPSKLDKDLYLLRVRVTDKNSGELTMDVNLKVNPVRHGLGIADVVFSPGTTVEAGHSLLTTVLVENFGGKDEEDVKVTLEMPELGLVVSDYIDEVKNGDKETTEEELFLRLPQCIAEGDYTARVTVKYNEGDTASQDFQLHVSANDQCQAEEEKLIITVGPETQNVVANQQAAYPVALTNAGTAAKTYVLELGAGEWAAASLSENLVVLEPGKTAVVYAYVTAKDAAAAGEKVVTLTIKSDNNVLKTIYLKANVVPQESNEGSGLNLRNGLEIALIVLVVVLVIVGLILGFSRLKKDEAEEGEEKTYY